MTNCKQNYSSIIGNWNGVSTSIEDYDPSSERICFSSNFLHTWELATDKGSEVFWFRIELDSSNSIELQSLDLKTSFGKIWVMDVDNTSLCIKGRHGYETIYERIIEPDEFLVYVDFKSGLFVEKDHHFPKNVVT